MKALLNSLLCCFGRVDSPPPSQRNDHGGDLLADSREMMMPVLRNAWAMTEADMPHARNQLLDATRALHDWAGRQSQRFVFHSSPLGSQAADFLRVGFIHLESDRPVAALVMFERAIRKGALEPAFDGIRRAAHQIEREIPGLDLPLAQRPPPIRVQPQAPATQASASPLPDSTAIDDVIDRQIQDVIENYFVSESPRPRNDPPFAEAVSVSPSQRC